MLTRWLGIVASLAGVLVAPAAQAALDRPPEILEYRQVGDQVRLLWAPGGDADGTLSEDVVSYTVQRTGLGVSGWTTIFSGDQGAMTHVDSIADSATWTDHRGGSVEYRVEAATSSDATLSATVALVPSLPVWIDEAYDGKARLAWVPSTSPHPAYVVHLGYKVQKWASGGWTDVTGYLADLNWLDAATTTGVSRYRVLSAYRNPHRYAAYRERRRNTVTTLYSNEVEIDLEVACQGQIQNPAVPPLTVIEIGDRDADLDYDGDDIYSALQACAAIQYEDLSGAGDDDGICEGANGETCITGGCILRALPVTYENVAIKITDLGFFCNDDLGADPSTWNDLTHPTHCLVAGPNDPLFPAGLVIEGHGSASVFRSPVRTPPYLPAPILEIHRKGFQLTLRNLVFDGRKHEQVYPGVSAWHSWWFMGLVIHNVGPWLDQYAEVLGDSLGDEDGYCDPERCLEAASGNDADGRCEPGETCVEDPATAGVDPNDECNTDFWTTAQGCVSTLENNDGCIHDLEVRDTVGDSIRIGAARRWIIEDSEVHDAGCVNRGYGYDCLAFESAPDATPPPGFKTFGIGMNFVEGNQDFQVRRNHVYRATKYGISFKNGNAGDCNALTRNNDVAHNHVHDLGAVGIFNHGSVGARIHHNTIGRTTTWNEPPQMNGNFGPFGMSLGGYCSDDNEFYANDVVDSGGMAIMWNGSSDTVTCSAPGSCAPALAVGNRIYQNAIDGACTERDASLAASPTFGYGAILMSMDSTGTMLLEDNELSDSRCRHSIQTYGPRDDSVGPFELRVASGSYESGPNVVTRQQGGFYCGAVHVYGPNRKVFIADGDDNTFINADDAVPKQAVPKACAGHAATLVIDDVPDPYGADFTPPENVGSSYGPTTIVQCSQKPTPCDSACQLLYADCD